MPHTYFFSEYPVQKLSIRHTAQICQGTPIVVSTTVITLFQETCQVSAML